MTQKDLAPMPDYRFDYNRRTVELFAIDSSRAASKG